MPSYPGRGPRRSTQDLKDGAKREVGGAFEFLRDFVLGDEEPEEFLARKAVTAPTSPKLIEALDSVLTPNAAPARVVEAEEVQEEGATPKREASAPKRRAPAAPPEPARDRGNLLGEERCPGCRIAQRNGFKACEEHR